MEGYSLKVGNASLGGALKNSIVRSDAPHVGHSLAELDNALTSLEDLVDQVAARMGIYGQETIKVARTADEPNALPTVPMAIEMIQSRLSRIIEVANRLAQAI